MRGDTFSAEREESSSRLCPLVLLVQVAWQKVRTFRREICKGLGSGQFLLWRRGGGAEPVSRILNAVEYRISMTALARGSNNCVRSGFGRKFLTYYWEGCVRSVKCNAEFGVNYSAFAIRSRKTTGNLDGFARLKDFSGCMLNPSQDYISCALFKGGNKTFKIPHSVMLREVTQNVPCLTSEDRPS